MLRAALALRKQYALAVVIFVVIYSFSVFPPLTPVTCSSPLTVAVLAEVRKQVTPGDERDHHCPLFSSIQKYPVAALR